MAASSPATGAGDGGPHNDGINIAAPLGTPVRAIDAGAVAYAGNELKGYGNLVLVRHANGWISAYAHLDDELLVKKGDTVAAGQVIAKVGDTGGVGEPQLHFELRRGKKPVDPERVPRSCRQRARRERWRRLGRAASLVSFFPSRPAKSWMNCQATRPERAPRVTDHSLASARSWSSADTSSP